MTLPVMTLCAEALFADPASPYGYVHEGAGQGIGALRDVMARCLG
jgi:hypothetical protein